MTDPTNTIIYDALKYEGELEPGEWIAGTHLTQSVDYPYMTMDLPRENLSWSIQYN